MKDNAENDAKAVGGHSTFFIDLTIATVLGTAAETDDCEVITVTQDRDTASMTASASAVSSSKQRKTNLSGVTPISSNKRRGR